MRDNHNWKSLVVLMLLGIHVVATAVYFIWFDWQYLRAHHARVRELEAQRGQITEVGDSEVGVTSELKIIPDPGSVNPEPLQVRWLGCPMTSDNDVNARDGAFQGWHPNYQIGLRSDGVVVVWRKAKDPTSRIDQEQTEWHGAPSCIEDDSGLLKRAIESIPEN